MSVATLLQGTDGISWPSAVLGVFLSLDLEYFKQSWQFSVKCSNCSFMPSQYMVSFALILHLLSPKCPCVLISKYLLFSCQVLWSLYLLSLSCVAICRLCKLLLLALSWLVIWLTWSYGNEIVSFWNPSLDRQSATWFVKPGIYLTLKW